MVFSVPSVAQPHCCVRKAEAELLSVIRSPYGLDRSYTHLVRTTKSGMFSIVVLMDKTRHDQDEGGEWGREQSGIVLIRRTG